MISRLILGITLVTFPAQAGELTDAERAHGIEALKLGYILNGNSMSRWGSIDLSGPVIPNKAVKLPPEPAGPTRKGDRLR